MIRGFTLVELMIVVAIIGILATLSAGEFTDMQYRAKRSEASLNVSGISTAQVALNAAMDTLVKGSSNPGTSLTKVARPFDPTMSGWSTLGWEPDGEVRCNYMTRTLSASHENLFRVSSNCDVDNDNSTYTVRWYAPRNSSDAGRWTVNDSSRY
jgi:prepilin-type N-terminal cleavage/methylation domain-containing protein